MSVPADDERLEAALASWQEAAREWRKSFDVQLKKTAGALGDERAKAQVRDRALTLLHAC